MAQLVKDQSRLIDHFKRVYSIIVGLALTEACKQLFPIDTTSFAFSSLWMFLALFFTVIPIFQGGDRFLDVTYMKQSLKPSGMRFAFVWDVYMLLLTALILVGVAKSIPLSNGSGHPNQHLNFFYGLAILFLFDVFTLVVGYVKSLIKHEIVQNYFAWIISNSILGGISLALGLMNDHVIFDIRSTSTLSFILMICTILRTMFDYAIDKEFMFPNVILSNGESAEIRPADPPSSS